MQLALLRSTNKSATEYYYNILAQSLNACGNLIFDGYECDELSIPKETITVVGSGISMFRLWMRGYRNLITWYQGLLPEESFMRNGGKFRKWVLERVELFSLRHSKMKIFVSEAMAKHYSEKYGINLGHYYVMPCFNTELQLDSIKEKNFKCKTFLYAGGLSKWQCIEQTLKLYRSIEERSQNSTKLLFLTPSVEEAKELIQKHGIVNAEVKYVHYSKMATELKNVTFGFALREKTPVNEVSTPTKLANYVANGIIPIYTNCIRDFHNISCHKTFKVDIDDVNDIQEREIARILELMDEDLSNEAMVIEFSDYFHTYYNTDWHVNNFANAIRKMVCNEL